MDQINVTKTDSERLVKIITFAYSLLYYLIFSVCVISTERILSQICNTGTHFSTLFLVLFTFTLEMGEYQKVRVASENDHVVFLKVRESRDHDHLVVNPVRTFMIEQL